VNKRDRAVKYPALTWRPMH